ncbi:MAG: polysaccharide biosynthesis/export family protein [Planctomycetota bacterium]|nr:polysaccharide biosynthesis/export family protein [Planctomycetota bacterium]
MLALVDNPFRTIQGRHRAVVLHLVIAATISGMLSGCAALTNPVANGIPVRLLPDELVATAEREKLQTIPLNSLKQPPPDVYRLGPNDVLGIYIPGVLPETKEPDQGRQEPASPPPTYFPSQIDPLARGLPAALGYPLPVREDGTVSLPLIDTILVKGKSIAETEAEIRETYTKKGILQAGRERIIVTLMQPRQSRVTVIRQETGGLNVGGLGGIIATSSKRGTGSVVSLRAYENDVLSALAETGGLPGLDCYDTIFIFKHAQGNAAIVQTLESLPAGKRPQQLTELCPQVVQIPTRMLPGQPPPFRPQDILLENGDVVFLEARAVDLFYTGGLLPAGEHILPRDNDLDVVEAVAKVQGSLLNGAFGGSNLSGAIINPRMGHPSPSLLTVLRRTPSGGQVPIRVDLNRAMRDVRERIRIQAGDVLILQETPGEAVARNFIQTFNFTIFSKVIDGGTTTGTAAITGP